MRPLVGQAGARLLKKNGYLRTASRNTDSFCTAPPRLTLSTSADYQFGAKQGHLLFCKTCGVRTFERGYVEQIGGHYVSIKVASLDDVDAALLVESPIRYANGRDNKWWEPPAETRHL